jgi:transmembrane sensor
MPFGICLFMRKERFTQLLNGYAIGAISAEEHDELFEMISSGDYDTLIDASLADQLKFPLQADAQAGLPPHIAQEIVRKIFAAEANTVKVLPIKNKLFVVRRWVAAASVIIIAAASFFVYKAKNSFAGAPLASFKKHIPGNTLEKINHTGGPLIVSMQDGSTVTLQSNAALHYPAKFSIDKREVYLEGAAFFNIAKDPNKPFLVYYNNVVTKVLGTSFFVGTNTANGNIEVAVKTGRVQVYENADFLKNEKKHQSVIVTPNQKVIYRVDTKLFETTLVDKPLTLSENENDSLNNKAAAFIYDRVKTLQLFKQLELTYGIEIVVENENIYNCVFTGDISTQELFDKLTIVCLSINAGYEINGTKIFIKGKGCN